MLFGFNLESGSLGTLLGGSWVSSILYGIAIVLYFQYFQSFKREHYLVRALVIFQLLLDTLGQFGQYTMVYQYCVTNWVRS